MASLFAVGLPFTYDGTTNHFATTSGGVATVAAITSADDVTLDANSPAGGAMTTSAAISCNTLTLATGFTGSLTMSNSLTAVGAITLSQGTLNTNGQTVSALQLTSATANTRTITLGASPVTLTGSAASVVVWDTSGGVSPTMTANTAVVTFNGAGGTAHNTFNSNGFNLNGMSAVFSGSGNILYNHSGTIANITRTGTAAKTDTLQFNSSVTITGTLTVNGNSTTNRMLVQSTTIGTTRTITSAAVSLSNVDWQDITAAGTASPFIGTSMGNCLGNTSITFDTPVAQTRSGAGGNWSTSGNWTSRVPLPQDNVIINGSSSGTISADMPRWGADMTFTGFAGTLTNSTSAIFYGSLTLGTGMTLTQNASATYTASGRSSLTITSNGVAIPGGGSGFILAAPGGTYTLQDAAPWLGNFQINNGTFNTNNFNWQCNIISESGSATRAITLGTSTVTLVRTSAGSIVSLSSSGMTFSGASSTIVIGNASANARLFTGGGLTYGTLQYTVAGSTGALQIINANTFSTINFSDTTAQRNLILPSATTTTVTTWNVNGTLGIPMSVTGSTAGSAATLALPNGVTTCNYIIFKDITVTGGTIKDINGQLVSGTTGITLAYARTAVPSTTPRQPANGLFLPGAASNFASCPDSASLRLTSDFDLRIYVLVNWSAVAVRMFIAKWGASKNYRFWVDGSKKLNLGISTDGSASTSTGSSTALPFSGENAKWVRVTWRGSDGRTQFFSSTDGVMWVQSGTDQTLAVTPFAGTAAVSLGADTGNVYAMTIYYADIRTNILNDGTGIVANPDFRSATSSGFTDAAGLVWTVNSSGIPSAQLASRQ